MRVKKVKKKLKLTFLIIKRDVSLKVTNYLKTFGFDDYFSFYGKGSASTALLDYLGMGQSEYNIVVYPTGEDEAALIMNRIKHSEFLKDVTAFRVPVKAISNMNALNHLLKEGK